MASVSATSILGERFELQRVARSVIGLKVSIDRTLFSAHFVLCGEKKMFLTDVKRFNIGEIFLCVLLLVYRSFFYDNNVLFIFINFKYLYASLF